MVGILHDRLAQGAHINIKLTKKFSRKVTSQNLLSVGLCCVTYPGQGKYLDSDEKEIAIRWEDVEDFDETPIKDVPSKSGWWPALNIQWNEQHEDHWMKTRGDYFAQVSVGCLPIFLLCWYQLADGSYELQAWPVNLYSRL